MLLTKYNNVITAVPSDRTDQSFTVAILPWRSRRGWSVPNAHRPKTPDKDIAVDAVPIANEITWPLLPSRTPPSVGDLSIQRLDAGCPKPQDLTAAMLKDE